MKKIFHLMAWILSLLVMSPMVGAQATSIQFLPEENCSQYWLKSSSEISHQCFNGGRVYLWGKWSVMGFSDTFHNNNDYPIVIFNEDPKWQAWVRNTFTPLQWSVWNVSRDTFGYPGDPDITLKNPNDAIKWYKFSAKNKEYFYFIVSPRESKLISQSKNNRGISLIEIQNNTNRNKPVMQQTVQTTSFGVNLNWNAISKLLNKKTHQEHAFYYPAWCGDGVVDAKFGEVYDDGVNNGKPGFASTDCKTKPEIPKIVPGICDGVSNGVATKTPPTKLCQTGTPSAVMQKDGKFVWTCGGINGGANATCEAPIPQDPPPPAHNGKCDEYFTGKKLRYNPEKIVSYGFSDNYHNKNSFAHTLTSFSVNFRESSDMNQDGKSTFDNFQWSRTFRADRIIPAGMRNVEIIEAVPPYRLLVPPTKRQKDNFYIEYIVNGHGNGKNFSHKECISYEVTWCGDGIVDVDEGEKCDPAAPGQSEKTCNPKTCQPQSPEKPMLKIKKMAKGLDAQTAGQAVTVTPNQEYDYTFVVRNVSTTTAAKGAKVVDIFPDAIEIVRVQNDNDWKCLQTGQKVVCSHERTIPANAEAPILTITAKIRPTTQTGQSIRNVAGVCELDPTKPQNSQECENNRTECKPGDVNYNPETNTCDPSTVTIRNENGLSIKKYSGNKDGQLVTDALEVIPQSEFTYTYEVKTSGDTDQKNVTVTDVFPLGVEVLGFQTLPTGWQCKNGTVNLDGKIRHSVICSTPTMAKNTQASIVVRSKLTTIDGLKALGITEDVFKKGLRNIAYVCSDEVKNPNPNTCTPKCEDPNNPICLPPPPPTECSDVPGNPLFDPACIIPNTPPPPPPPPPPTTPPPPPAIPPGPGGYVPNPYCGDGIVQEWEICDPGTGHSGISNQLAYADSLTCLRDCSRVVYHYDIQTYPGAREMTYKIKIPQFSAFNLGSSFNENNEKKFEKYGMKVGKGSNLFTLADQIILSIEAKNWAGVAKTVDGELGFYMQFYMENNGVIDNVTSSDTRKLSTFGDQLPYFTHPRGNKRFYILGKDGDIFSMPEGSRISENSKISCENVPGITRLPSSIKACILKTDSYKLILFKGKDLTNFKGKGEGIGNVSLNANFPLATFPVKVVDGKNNFTTSDVKRILEKISSQGSNTLQAFTPSSGASTQNSQSPLLFGSAINTISIKSQVRDEKINNQNINQYKHNGNDNLYAIKENVTIGCDNNQPFEMKGVKTLLVEGSITFACDTKYAGSDDSWAFIAKGGNIKVNSSVKNLAGVFLAIPGDDSNTGKFTADTETSEILKIEGSLYGNANDLFQKRTYARQTTSYAVMTTGTVITYSNRALRNPPPLLSQYLNTYQVQRVLR